MTRREYEEKYGQKPAIPVSRLDTTPAPRRMTRAEYDAEFGVKETPQESSIKDPIEEFNRFKSNVEGARQGAMEQVTKGVGQIDATKPVQSIEGGLNIGAGAVNYLFAPIAPVFEPLGKGIDYVGNKIGDSKFLQEATQSDPSNGGTMQWNGAQNRWEPAPEKQVQAKPDTTINSLERLFEGIVNLTTVASAVDVGSLKAPKGKVSFEGPTSFPDPMPQTPKVATKVADEIYNVESNYKGLRDANLYEKDNGQASRLRIASTDVLANAVDEDGLIRTRQPGGAVDQYRKMTIDGVEGVVRENLKREGTKVTLSDIRDALIQEVYASGLEGGDLVTALRGIGKELKGLSLRAVEKGDILLETVHDAKISTTRNIDFNTPIETKTYRKAVARAYKNLVEQKSTFTAKVGDKTYGVKDINAELSKYYGDIERLENLDGRRVKGGKLGKYAAQMSGNIVGMAAGAVAGPLGASVGSAIGGKVASKLQGKAMASTFGKESNIKLPKNQILEAASKTAKEPVVRDPKIADPVVKAGKGASKNKEIADIEKQIEKNVRDQKKAIKAKDYTLVSALKEIYDVLVSKLRQLIQRVKETPNKQGGFARNPFAVVDIPKSIRPESVASKMDSGDFYAIEKYLREGDKAKTAEVKTILKEMGISKADVDIQDKFLRETLDEYRALDEKRFDVKSQSIPKELEPLAQEANKYKSAEEFMRSMTAPKLRQFLNETTPEGQVKTASAKATGARTRKEGDYIYAQDRGYFDALLSDIQSGRNIESGVSKDLTDLWKKAQKEKPTPIRGEAGKFNGSEAAIPKDLATEARKYKSAELSRWKNDDFWGKTITDKSSEVNVPISEIGKGKTIGVRQSQVTEKGVQEWITRIEKGERPAILVGNRPMGKREITVLDGNHTLEAYKRLGFKEIPVIDIKSQLTEIWKKANGKK